MKKIFKNYSYLIACAVLTITFYGCSKQPKFQAMPTEGVILAFGDSLTAGYGTTPENSYPSILEMLSGHKVINAGISGETTAGGLERFASTLDEAKPSLVILMEGGNDILQSQNLKVTEDNLLKMINEAKTRNIPVLLVGVPAKGIINPKTADFYKTIAKQTGVLYDDKTIASLIKKEDLKSDLVHFNAAGYQKMAEAFDAELKQSGIFGKK